jgi:hypothetical protein
MGVCGEWVGERLQDEATDKRALKRMYDRKDIEGRGGDFYIDKPLSGVLR